MQASGSLIPTPLQTAPIVAEISPATPGHHRSTDSGLDGSHVLFAEDGSHLELLPLIHALLQANIERTPDQFELQNIAEDMDAYAVITVGPGWTIEFEGEQRSLYVERRVEGQEPELLRIDGMRITAKAVIRVGENQMQARRLAELDVNYAFGEGLSGDRQALIVVTEGESGGKLWIEFEKNRKTRRAGPTSTTPRATSRAFTRCPTGAAAGAASMVRLA